MSRRHKQQARDCVVVALEGAIALFLFIFNACILHTEFPEQHALMRNSYDSVVWNDGVLDDHHNAIFDHKSLTFPVALGHTLLVDDLNISSDARVLVDDTFPDSASWTCITKQDLSLSWLQRSSGL